MRTLVFAAAIAGLVQELVYRSVRAAMADAFADPVASVRLVQADERRRGVPPPREAL